MNTDRASVGQQRPVNVLTGFLGSGKTTLLQRILRNKSLSNCAVLVNEFGSVGLDDLFLDAAGQDTIVLPNGCICCAVRDDLGPVLLKLLERGADGSVPAFDRVVIETSGVADPAPIINTVVTNRVLRHHFRIGSTVAVVDGVHGVRHLQEHEVSRKQVALADRIVISKADIASAHQIQAVYAVLDQLARTAPVVVSHNDADEAVVKLTHDVVQAGEPELSMWFTRTWGDGSLLRAAIHSVRCADDFSRHARPDGRSHPALTLPRPHMDIYDAVALECEAPLNWVAFSLWLSMFVHRYGAQLLRIKALLHIEGGETPIALHGVHATIYPPVHMSRLACADHMSRIVLIGYLPAAGKILESLEAFGASKGRFRIVNARDENAVTR